MTEERITGTSTMDLSGSLRGGECDRLPLLRTTSTPTACKCSTSSDGAGAGEHWKETTYIPVKTDTDMTFGKAVALFVLLLAACMTAASTHYGLAKQIMYSTIYLVSVIGAARIALR